MSRPQWTTRTLLAAATAAGAALGTGCSDRLTAPEAMELVDSLEAAVSPQSEERRQNVLDGIMRGWGDKLARIPGISQVHLRRDGRLAPYRALVFERVMVPPGGIEDRSGCAGTRWFAVFWREGEEPGVIGMSGGRFHGQWVQGFHSCPDVYFTRPEPSLYFSPGQRAPGQNTLWATEGEGDISPGEVTGECAFLESEDRRLLQERYGITCAMTRHRVRFRVRLTSAGSSETSILDLQPAEIIGFRYTIQCDSIARPEANEPYCAGRVVSGKSARTIAEIRSVSDLDGFYYPRQPIYLGQDQLAYIWLTSHASPIVLQASRNLEPEWFNCREQVVSLDTLHLSCEDYGLSKRRIRVDGSFLLKGLRESTVNERDVDVLSAVVSVTNEGRPVYSGRHRFAFRPH